MTLAPCWACRCADRALPIAPVPPTIQHTAPCGRFHAAGVVSNSCMRRTLRCPSCHAASVASASTAASARMARAMEASGLLSPSRRTLQPLRPSAGASAAAAAIASQEAPFPRASTSTRRAVRFCAASSRLCASTSGASAGFGARITGSFPVSRPTVTAVLNCRTLQCAASKVAMLSPSSTNVSAVGVPSCDAMASGRH